ncbi:MAG: ATP-binding protein [Pseudomonadota bacterium]
MFPHKLTLANFRSIINPLTIPFSKKVTLLVGPNNIGKSNVLRLLSIIFNNSYNLIDNTYDFYGPDKDISLSVSMDKDSLIAETSTINSLSRRIEASDFDGIILRFTISKDRISISPSNDDIFRALHRSYFVSSDFLADFGSRSSDSSANVTSFIQKISPLYSMEGTTYLPNIRYITEDGHEPKQFAKSKLAGETVAFGKVIETLSRMDRPSFEDMQHQSEILRNICDFMAFCLDRKSVTIQVPADRKTILIGIDGEVRPLASLGTGIEQLLMIGLASIGFPGRLVLIDEPELHLHPTAQRRIMKYLAESVEAQFVMATHSAPILDAIDADIIQLSMDDRSTTSRTIVSNRDRSQAVRDLGHSPSELVQTKYAIWVEGPSDRIYLNHWISKIDPTLVEGIEYTILFYGGKILSQHSFEDAENDLVKAATLCRAFAVVIDSDRKPEKPNINATKSRVRTEIEGEQGFCWITDGREIENYIPIDVVRTIATDLVGVTPQTDKREQILDASKVNKVEFARRVVSVQTDEWPLDLKKMVTELVSRIQAAR